MANGKIVLTDPETIQLYHDLRRKLGMDAPGVTPIMDQIDRYASASADAVDPRKSRDVQRASADLARSLRDVIKMRVRNLM